MDFDAIDDDVTNAVLPYFRGIQEALNLLGNPYSIGIYGPINVCKRVAKENITLSSFVCDMSTGFSGNLGYSLPADWTFDQISTITIGSGDGQIEIDNNIFSGKNYNPATNSSDWRTDCINRGWGPITMESYYKKMLTLFQDSICASVNTHLNNPNGLTTSFWKPGSSDIVGFANAFLNNKTYAVWIGNTQYDTTKPGFMRVYEKNSAGTIRLTEEYKLKSSLTVSDVKERFVKGAKNGLKLKFFKAIDKFFAIR